MTTLGKILIFVNLVFSVVVGILISMAYAGRTNWKIAHDNVKKAFDVQAALVQTYAGDYRAEKKAHEDDVKRLAADRDLANKMVAEAKKELESEKARHLSTAEQRNLVTNNNTHVAAELTQRQNEVKQLQMLLAQSQQQLIDEQTQKKELRDRYVRADIAGRTSHNRTKELMETVERLTEEVDRLKGGTAVAGRGARKPPEDVKGIVTSIDAKSDLVTISIGSDAGLSKGNSLQVYRLAPEPKYLGELLIVDANHHEAVGRLRPPQRTALLQRGDTVASSIMGAH